MGREGKRVKAVTSMLAQWRAKNPAGDWRGFWCKQQARLGATIDYACRGAVADSSYSKSTDWTLVTSANVMAVATRANAAQTVLVNALLVMVSLLTCVVSASSAAMRK